MDSIAAFAKGMASRDQEQKVFDWDTAAQLIKEKKPIVAEAGLKDDWEWTGGKIYVSGDPIMDSYTWLSSTWATPQLMLDNVYVDCYIMASETAWSHHTKWPKSALEILEKGKP